MTTYAGAILSSKKFKNNVIIQIGANYFGIRQPDTGLVISSPYDKTVASLLLNPTTVDLRRVTTTISSFSFRLIDKLGVISSLILGDASALNGQEVKIYLGRSDVNMDFADYFQLPVTYVQKIVHSDNSYTFSTTEQTERIARPIYDYQTALGVDILAATTTWTMRDDITSFPSSGFLKVENEFVSYTGKDLVNNRFTGVIRGELESVPAAHSANVDVVLAESITDNPLNIILKILISGGGGGVYDTLQSGLGISNTLIDVAGIETLRDDLFPTTQFTLTMYSIPSALKYIEDQLLAPNNMRFTVSADSKLTLVVLDRAEYVEEDNVIDANTMTKFPKWTVDITTLTNKITVDWDFDEGTGQYQKRTAFQDDTSIADYGASPVLAFQFKGVKSTLDGTTIVSDFGQRLLARLAYPTPIIEINTQIDKSLQNVGDKSYVKSDKIPAADGTLNFSSDLEILSRAINHTNGDVQFKLAFTSFTNIRSGFIAPSDLVTSFASQKSVNIASGRGSYYQVGFYMRLWDETLQAYTADAPNKITEVGIGPRGLLTESGDTLILDDGSGALLAESSSEDTLVFENNWTTALIAGQHRLRFADYDDASDSQKRFAYISAGGANFSDGKPTYKVTY